MLLVHAHPDDESILTGGVIAGAHRDGHRVVLVTATRGETGGHGPAGNDAPPASGEVRTEELLLACEILGVDRQEFLGFRASSMPAGSDEDGPGSFQSVPTGDAVAALAPLLREERPDVVVTYGADGTYGHPDHVRAHQITLAALDVLDTEGWQPRKVYAHAVPQTFVLATVAAAAQGDIALPESLAGVAGTPDDQITTVVDVSEVLDIKLAACVVHRSQMHPGLALATLAADLFQPAFGVERFVLLRGELGPDRPETDMFAGV